MVNNEILENWKEVTPFSLGLLWRIMDERDGPKKTLSLLFNQLPDIAVD